jgi:predicted translin family RNA/ssDNA-binding protein
MATAYSPSRGKTAYGSRYGSAKFTARVRNLGHRIPQSILTSKEYSQHTSTIQERFESVGTDLNGLNAYRYQRQISPGIQEFMEAVLFQHYIETQSILSPAESAKHMPEKILLTEDDYILGLFDMTGELMRYSITQLATSGGPTSKSAGGGKILTVLQNLRRNLEALDARGSFGLAKEFERKMSTTKASVEKVENAVYSLTVRGKERPKGWNPGSDASREVVEVEG